MTESRRKPEGPGFGHSGGSNLSDYLGAAARSHQIELEMQPGELLVEIPVDLIDRSPYQARIDFDPTELAALGEDISANGLNHPVTVREVAGGRYQLVAGERRWLAAQHAGLTCITARIRPLADFEAHLVGVSENNRRANLSPWEMSMEAARILEHAKEASQPHSQKALSQYLNRNVAIVNQQLAIAAAIGPDLLERTQVNEANLCRLAHVTLHRISKLAEAQRPRALKEAIRVLDARTPHPCYRPTASVPPTQKQSEAGGGDWQRLWETGGFQMRLRRPFKELNPKQAERYVQQVAPALCGLAARASDGRNGEVVMRWESPLGTLLFVRPHEGMSDAERANAREALAGMIAPPALQNPDEGPLGGAGSSPIPEEAPPMESTSSPGDTGPAFMARTIALRSRSEDGEPLTLFRHDWDDSRIALVICDMWDATQCVSAARRVAEMAPRINEVAGRLRREGALIIHAPAGCTEFYAGTAARERARRAPRVKSAVPVDWQGWDASREAPLPAALADETPCSCEPGEACTEGGPPYPWTRQIASIEIATTDAVTDDGEELLALLEERGIEDVVVLGVHLNRCVLGRPYGIRQLVYWGKRPLLCRDLTDSYHRDPAGHLEGNEEMIAHVERWWCPSITSDELVGGTAFQFQSDRADPSST